MGRDQIQLLIKFQRQRRYLRIYHRLFEIIKPRPTGSIKEN